MTLLPKVIGGYSGTMVDSFGYVNFFMLAAALGVPVLLLVWVANRHVELQLPEADACLTQALGRPAVSAGDTLADEFHSLSLQPDFLPVLRPATLGDPQTCIDHPMPGQRRILRQIAQHAADESCVARQTDQGGYLAVAGHFARRDHRHHLPYPGCWIGLWVGIRLPALNFAPVARTLTGTNLL